MSKPVVTRFAPSPTGFLHIGGARTALFNWLFARAHGGKMLLRIEDTDRQRSSDEAVTAILDGLSWLGIEGDGEPISQFSRIDRHREVAEQMLENGTAYRCYSTPKELDAMREKARAEGRNPMYDGTWREKSPADWPDDTPYVVRLKTPEDGSTVIDDKVQGTVTFPNADLDDFVILRSDTTPTYMLAVVVDDHDMGVTHIIRGDDHLTNAAKQMLIFNAMKWDVPVMGHIPLIHGEDGAKLSKRHGAIGAEAYRAMGYLPAALRNYLVRLGWAHGDDEIMTLEQMIAWFGFDGMNKSATRFDFAKLDALNAHYMRELPAETLLESAISILPEVAGGNEIAEAITDKNKPQLLAAMPAFAERAKTLLDIISSMQMIVANRPLSMDEKAEGLTSGDNTHILSLVAPALSMIDLWDHDNIAAQLKHFCEENNLKLGKVAQPIRAALTGRATSPGAFDMLQILGKQESLARIQDRL